MAKKDFSVTEDVRKAVKSFWRIKRHQFRKSNDPSNRGAVVAGKQMDGFLTLLRNACLDAGVPDSCIYDVNNYVPGFFRSSKDWDFMIISPGGKLIALIELKSQVGSYGNNFNNRTEEALGSATDLWTAYREKQFPTCGTPWVGYLMLIGRDQQSTKPVKNHTNHFPVRKEFEASAYIDRYRIFCEKLMSERLYTSSCLIWTESESSYGEASLELSPQRFISSLQGYLIGCKDEFC